MLGMFQFVLFLVCHPIWDIRKAAYDAIGKILVGSPQLSEAIMLEFADFLSVVGAKTLANMR